MFEKIKALHQRRMNFREVAGLSNRELDDLGMTRAQIEAFVGMPQDVPDRVTAMARIFGLSDAEIKAENAQYADLLVTCGGCKDRKACKTVLSLGDEAHPEDAAFCLNSANFVELRA